uniref:DUF3987 domain-containing protein n=1 Tax=viral metagenome TaxID=1070528 RepID=A0A6M3IP95_9ZZZZ
MPIHVQSTHDVIESLIPSKGWLFDYYNFSKNLEACPRFKFFTACCVMGAIINNRVWIQRGDEGLLPKLFPNVWVILLAPPGRGHKTSTINMGVNCLTQAAYEIRILADKLTPESLVKALSAPIGEEGRVRIGPSDATGLIKAPELSVFFGKQQYNTGLVSLITDLYDYREEWSSETIMRGRSVLKNVCISILGGSTPTWLQKMLPEDAFTGGFMSRFILCEMPATYFKRVAFPEKTNVGAKWSHVVDGLRRLLAIHGEMSWSPEARDAYKKYYENLLPSGEVQRDAYQEREAEQILRVSMLLALSEGEMELGLKHFIQARRIIDSLMTETQPRIEHLTTHPRMQLVQDIQELLKQFGKMQESDLMKRVYRGLSLGELQFREAIKILKISNIIDQEGFKDPVYSMRKGGKR